MVEIERRSIAARVPQICGGRGGGKIPTKIIMIWKRFFFSYHTCRVLQLREENPKNKKMFTQQSLTCTGLERSLIKKKKKREDLRLSHHNQYYIALATSQSSYTGALYILDPLCAPPTVPAGLIALMDLLELPRHQRQATGHRGRALRWWLRYVVVNLSMWKPDSDLIIILSRASACTEDTLSCSADNQLIFMLPIGAVWKVVMTAIIS